MFHGKDFFLSGICITVVGYEYMDNPLSYVGGILYPRDLHQWPRTVLYFPEGKE